MFDPIASDCYHANDEQAYHVTQDNLQTITSFVNRQHLFCHFYLVQPCTYFVLRLAKEMLPEIIFAKSTSTSKYLPDARTPYFLRKNFAVSTQCFDKRVNGTCPYISAILFYKKKKILNLHLQQVSSIQRTD